MGFFFKAVQGTLLVCVSQYSTYRNIEEIKSWHSNECSWHALFNFYITAIADNNYVHVYSTGSHNYK